MPDTTNASTRTASDWRLKLYRGWWYAARRENGATIRRSLRTTERDVAKQRLEDLKVSTDQHLSNVREIVAAYRAAKAEIVSAERAAYAWKNLEPAFAHLRPDQISREICAAYTLKRRRDDDVSNGTIRRELSLLSSAFNWHDPRHKAIIQMPPPAEPRDRHLTHDEYHRLIEAAAALHVQVFIALALTTAARKEAILTLTWDRVDIERKIINLGRGHRQKGRAVVPINDFATVWLKKAREAAVSDFVIEWAGGPVLSIRKGFEAACERAQLEDVTPHTLRHTAAVWMAEARVPMSEIAQYLGHRDSRTTERIYARYSPDYLRGAASALNPKRA